MPRSEGTVLSSALDPAELYYLLTLDKTLLADEDAITGYFIVE